MNNRGYLLSSIGVVVLLGGLARPAHAVKQTNYAMGAACQPASLLNVVSPLTYTNAGVMNQGLLAVDVICPLTWSKQQAVASWQNLARGRHRGRLARPSGRSGRLVRPNWGCTLAYQTAGGSLSMQNLADSVPASGGHAQHGVRCRWSAPYRPRWAFRDSRSTCASPAPTNPGDASRDRLRSSVAAETRVGTELHVVAIALVVKRPLEQLEPATRLVAAGFGLSASRKACAGFGGIGMQIPIQAAQKFRTASRSSHCHSGRHSGRI